MQAITLRTTVMLLLCNSLLIAAVARDCYITEDKIPISAVKVYETTAQIQRQGRISLDTDQKMIVISGLSPYLLEESVRVSSTGDFQLLSVKVLTDYGDRIDYSSEIETLIAKNTELSLRIKKLEASKRVLTEEYNLLVANRVLEAGQQGSDLDQLKATAQYYRERLEAIEHRKLDIDAEITGLSAEMSQLQEQITDLRQPVSTSATKSVAVEIINTRAQSVELTIDYMVAGAGWSSHYDLKVDDLADGITLIHKAQIWQNTGVNWDDVQVSLSTAQPTASASHPALKPWWLSRQEFRQRDYDAEDRRYEHLPYNPAVREIRGIITDRSGEPLIAATVEFVGHPVGTSTDVDGSYRMKVPVGARRIRVSYVGFKPIELNIFASQMDLSLQEGLMLDELVVTGKLSGIRGSKSERANYYVDGVRVSDDLIQAGNVLSTEIQRSTSVEYLIDVPVTVQSGDDDKNVTVAKHQLETSYEHHATPKLDPNVYLIALMTDWDQYSFPDGKTNLYLEGGYVGSSYLNFSAETSDSIKISLGRDENVVVQRNPIALKNRNTFLTGKRVAKRAYEYKIRNRRSSTSRLILHDQIPVSTEKEIVIDYTAAGAEINEDTGELTWTINLAPSEEVSREMRFEVKYPKHMRLKL